MLLFIIPVLIIVWVIVRENWLTTYGATEGEGLLAFFSLIFLLILLIVLPIERMEWRANLLMIEAIRATYTDARTNGLPLESAAIQTDIAKWNAKLASAHYYNNYFDWFIPDEVLSVEPIR